VKPRPRFPWGLGVRVALVAGLLAALALPGRTEEPKSRDQQIADIEKQIQALSKQIAELKKSSATAPTPATPTGIIPPDWVSSFSWRSIGPATMGGRITAISVFEADPTTYWVATASGGLLKTVNNGITFGHQFDREATVSIGAVCVAPSDRNVVYVGTGENNPRNSVSYGDGVYKSTDGGKTWKNVGLRQSYQVGKIVVHPTDPNTVYVGALGRLYGPSEERGVFKTTDGGQHWEKVFYVDDKTGVIDLVMQPANPDTLLAALWERKRDEFDNFLGEPPPPDGVFAYDPLVKYGKGGGIYKTTDAGKNWKKLDKGLPTVATGRIGLDYYRKDPSVLFAVIDTEKIGTGLPLVTVYLGIEPEDAEGGVKIIQVAENSPAAKAGLKKDDVLTALGDKALKGTSELYEALRGKKANDKVRVKYKRGGEEKEVEVTLTNPPGPGGRGGFGGGRGGRGGQQVVPTAGFRAEPTEGGLKVTQVSDEGPAGKAGLKINDVIVSFGGQPVSTFIELMRDIATNRKVGDKVKVSVKRDERTVELELTLAEARFGGGPAATGRGAAGTPRPYSSQLGGQRENVQAQQGPEGYQTGGVYKSTDGGETWARVNSVNPRPMYFSVVRVDPTDENHVWVCGVSLYYSDNGGKRFQPGRDRGVHSDQHALWINPKDGRHMLIGTDGGFYQTYDRGEQWDHMNHAGALGQFYHVAVDPRRLYYCYGGLQDNGSWGGPAMTLRGEGPINEDWLFVSGGDGFVCRVDPSDPDVVYAESQGGNMLRRNLKSGERAMIRPRREGDQGGRGGGPGRRGGGGGAAAQHRFNWNTPFILSNHNPSIFYAAGEHVFRSVKRGDDLKPISPEITRTKHGSGTALAESPRNPDVLWVGTDDGALWVTRDGGVKWTNVADKVGLPGPRWVATIEPSRYADGRCYACFDAHRSNDDKPYVYVSENFGDTWKCLNANLPELGSTRCLREDIQNQNLLLCGTEFAAFASINRGGSWTKINNNLPTVAVHEFAFHPTAGEVVAATHGRSLWVLDVAPLRQMSEELMRAAAHLYQPTTAVRWRMEPGRESPYSQSARKFVGTNPPFGATVYYSLGKPAQKVGLKVVDYAGQTVRELKTETKPGLHKVVWDLSRPSARPMIGMFTGEIAPELMFGFAGGGFGGRGAGVFSQPVQPGVYRLVLNVDGKDYTQPLRVEPDPNRPSEAIAAGGDGDSDDGDMDK
jgi:photosystem II stability/assembly factor-like uncharacterized protein